MAFDFTLVHGNPQMLDHTPPTAVAAGKSLTIGDAVRISHLDIPANQLGALAAGGGVYDGKKTTGAGTALADGEAVYLTPGGSLTGTASGNTRFGVVVGEAGDDDEFVRVQHNNTD